jgi:recombination protein RecT
MAKEPGKQLAPLAAFREMLEKQTDNFARVMPPAMVGRFIHTVLTLLTDHPELQRCTPRSLIMACRRAAEDGLMLDGHEAAIVPFRDSAEVLAQYVPMIFGIRKKVRGTGLVSDWTVTPVFEGDDYDYALGSNPYVHHKPAITGGQKRPLVGVYSIATFPDGTKSFEIMNADQIADIRSLSKAKSGPWNNPMFYAEMARKTCARRHAKQLPQSSDISAFFRRMDEDDGALPPKDEPERITSRPSSVADTLDQFGAGGMPELEHQPSSERVTEEQHAPTADRGGAGSTARAPEAQQPEAEVEKPDVDAVRRAYRRGQDDRRAGKKPDDLPEEFTTNDRNREQLAWWAGFDGKPMPTWEQRQ